MLICFTCLLQSDIISLTSLITTLASTSVYTIFCKIKFYFYFEGSGQAKTGSAGLVPVPIKVDILSGIV